MAAGNSNRFFWGAVWAASIAACFSGPHGICGDQQALCGVQLLWPPSCVNLATDPNNCGACFAACPEGGVCNSGHCVCPAGQVVCGDECADLASAKDHCGSCGNDCGSGTCANGTCTCDDGPTVQVCGGSPVCVDTASDPKHCGSCDGEGSVCPLASEACTDGQCACPAGLPGVCSGACVNILTDYNNCGDCGVTCSGGWCDSGSCVDPGPSPDPCSDPSTSPYPCPLPDG